MLELLQFYNQLTTFSVQYSKIFDRKFKITLFQHFHNGLRIFFQLFWVKHHLSLSLQSLYVLAPHLWYSVKSLFRRNLRIQGIKYFHDDRYALTVLLET